MIENELTTPDAEDEAFGISDLFVDEVLEAVDNGDSTALSVMLDPVHPADIAHLIEVIDSRRRKELLTLWQGGLNGEILSELDENLREEVINSLAPSELADAVRDLDSDDVVDLVEDLPDKCLSGLGEWHNESQEPAAICDGFVADVWWICDAYVMHM